MCDDTFTTRVATNMQGYKKVIDLLEYQNIILEYVKCHKQRPGEYVD